MEHYVLLLLEEFMGFQIKDYICKCAVHCILKDSKCKGMPIFFLQLQFYFPIQICHDHTKYILCCMLLLRLIEGEIQNYYWMKTEINCILGQERSQLKVVGAAIFYIDHSLIRGVLLQSCSTGAKNFTNYVFCHPQFSGVIQNIENHSAILTTICLCRLLSK